MIKGIIFLTISTILHAGLLFFINSRSEVRWNATGGAKNVGTISLSQIEFMSPSEMKNMIPEKNKIPDQQPSEKITQVKKIEKIEKTIFQKEKPALKTQQQALKKASQPAPNDDREAGLLHVPPTVYPIRAEQRRQSGTVLLKIKVDDKGHVKAVQLARSSGYRLLDQSAIDQVKRYEFIPARRNHINVSSWVFLPFQFELREK